MHNYCSRENSHLSVFMLYRIRVSSILKRRSTDAHVVIVWLSLCYAILLLCENHCWICSRNTGAWTNLCIAETGAVAGDGDKEMISLGMRTQDTVRRANLVVVTSMFGKCFKLLPPAWSGKRGLPQHGKVLL